MSFRAAVIGLGGIGQGYDYADATDARVLTHAAAYHHHPAFRLVGGVDPDPEARARFEAKFAVPAFESVAALGEHAAFEVISVAVPTPLHALAFREALALGPRAIVCEKPLAPTLDEARAMVAAAEAAGCLLLVNHFRRFEPGVVALRERLSAGELGRLDRGVAWYTKGLLNNGSHLIDLLRHLLGEPTAVQTLVRRPSTLAGDVEPDLQWTFPGATVYMLAAPHERFSFNELQLLGERGGLWYERGGEVIRLRPAIESPLFPGYRTLAEEATLLPTDFQRYQWHVVDALRHALETGAPLASTGASALGTLEALATVRSLLQEVPHA